MGRVPGGVRGVGNRRGAGRAVLLSAGLRAGGAKGSRRGFRGGAARLSVLSGPRGPQRGTAGLRRRRRPGPRRLLTCAERAAIAVPSLAVPGRRRLPAASLAPQPRPGPPQPPPGTAAAAGSAAAISPADRSRCPAPKAQPANSPPPAPRLRPLFRSDGASGQSGATP